MGWCGGGVFVFGGVVVVVCIVFGVVVGDVVVY